MKCVLTVNHLRLRCALFAPKYPDADAFKSIHRNSTQNRPQRARRRRERRSAGQTSKFSIAATMVPFKEPLRHDITDSPDIDAILRTEQ